MYRKPIHRLLAWILALTLLLSVQGYGNRAQAADSSQFMLYAVGQQAVPEMSQAGQVNEWFNFFGENLDSVVKIEAFEITTTGAAEYLSDLAIDNQDEGHINTRFDLGPDQVLTAGEALRFALYDADSNSVISADIPVMAGELYSVDSESILSGQESFGIPIYSNVPPNASNLIGKMLRLYPFEGGEMPSAVSLPIIPVADENGVNLVALIDNMDLFLNKDNIGAYRYDIIDLSDPTADINAYPKCWPDFYPLRDMEEQAVEIHQQSPQAVAGDIEDMSYFFNINGTNLDRITHVGIYDEGDQEVTGFTTEDSGDGWRNFRLVLNNALTVGGTYTVRYTLDNGFELERPLAVVDITYEVSGVAPAGRSTFNIGLNLQGVNPERLAGKTVNYYSYTEYSQSYIGSGTVQSTDGTYYMSFVPDDSTMTGFMAGSKLTYSILTGGSDFSADCQREEDIIQVAPGSVVLAEAMVENTDADAFTVHGYGLDAAMNSFDRVWIEDDYGNEAYVIKDTSVGIDPQISVAEGMTGMEGFESWTITVPKAVAALVDNEVYFLRFATNGDMRLYPQILRRLEVSGCSPMFITEQTAGAWLDVHLWGQNMQAIQSGGLYEVGSDVNLMFAMASDFRNYGEDIYLNGPLMQPLTKGTAYEWRFTDGTTDYAYPLTMTDLTYRVYNEGMPTGRTEFLMSAEINGTVADQFMGSTVDLIDAGTAESLGTGTFVKFEDGYYLAASMNAPVSGSLEAKLANLQPAPQMQGYEAANLEENKVYWPKDNLLLNPIWKTFESSINSGTIYDFALMTYNVTSATIQDYTEVRLVNVQSQETAATSSASDLDMTVESPYAAVYAPDVLHVQVSQNLVPAGDYELQFFKDGQMIESIGTFTVPDPLTIDSTNILNLCEMQPGNWTELTLYGTGLQRIDSDGMDDLSGLYDADGSRIADMILYWTQDSGRMGGAGLKISDSTPLLAGDYTLRLYDNAGQYVQLPIHVGKWTYSTPPDAFITDATEFYVPLYLEGMDPAIYEDITTLQGELMEHNGPVPASVGTAQAEWIGSSLVWHITMTSGTVQEMALYSVEITNGDVLPREQPSPAPRDNKVVLAVDTNAVEASLIDSDMAHYKIVLAGYGLSDQAADYEAIGLYQDSEAGGILLRDLLTEGTMVLDSTGLYEQLTIDIPGEALEGDMPYIVKLRFAGNDYDEWNHFWIKDQNFEVMDWNGDYMTPKDDQSWWRMEIFGNNMSSVTGFKIYESTDAGKESLVDAVYDADWSRLQVEMTMKPGEVLEVGKTYVMQITSSMTDEPAEHPFQVAPSVMYYGNYSLMTGANQFLIPVWFDTQGEFPVGQTVSYFSEADLINQAAEGTIIQDAYSQQCFIRVNAAVAPTEEAVWYLDMADIPGFMPITIDRPIYTEINPIYTDDYRVFEKSLQSNTSYAFQYYAYSSVRDPQWINGVSIMTEDLDGEMTYDLDELIDLGKAGYVVTEGELYDTVAITVDKAYLDLLGAAHIGISFDLNRSDDKDYSPYYGYDIQGLEIWEVEPILTEKMIMYPTFMMKAQGLYGRDAVIGLYEQTEAGIGTENLFAANPKYATENGEDFRVGFLLADGVVLDTLKDYVLTVDYAGQHTEVSMPVYRDFIPDADGDGLVEMEDLEAMKNYYNMPMAFPDFDKYYDLNNDGIVDLYDLVLLSRRIE